MKLLLDFNLSPKLIEGIADLFPHSVHIRNTGLEGEAPDGVIWRYAKENGFVILTSDSDFVGLVHRYGYSPKVLRLAGMDYRTVHAVALIRSSAVLISEFEKSERGLLVLRP